MNPSSRWLKSISIVTLLAGLIGSSVLNAQDKKYTFTGTVTEAGTGNPLADVNVYISGTMDGAATDSSGHYRFTSKQSGPHEIVASIVGYEGKKHSVTIGSRDSYNIDFELEENTFELDEIEVTASNREWSSRYQSFRNFFIGTDSFSDNVVIKNPEVLEIEQGRSGELVVTAKEALQIENRALGYNIKAELEQVRFYNSKNTGTYKIYPKFTPMEAPDKKTKKRWERNREKAYEGSMRHFLKSLYHSRLRSNDFYMSPTWGLKEANTGQTIGILQNRGVYRHSERYKVFYFEAQQVAVGHDVRTDRGGRILNKGELSYLSPEQGNRYFLVNRQGLLFDPQSIGISGNWGNDRLSKLLPYEYTP